MTWPPTTHQDVEDAVSVLHDTGVQRSAPATGLYYSVGGTVGSAAIVANMYLYPVWLPACTLDRLACYLTTAATGGSGGLVRLGLYATSSGMPDALVVDAGSASTESTGAKEFTISTPVTAGMYWFAAAVQVATATFRTVADYLPGFGAAAVPSTSVAGFSKSGVTGALPDPAGSVSTIPTNSPRVYYRRSA